MRGSGTNRIGGAELFRASALVAISALVLAVSASAPAAADELVVDKRTSGAKGKQAIEDYWTRKRMKAARPLRALLDERGEVRVGRASKRPMGPAPYSAGAVADPTASPNRVHGKLFGRIKGIGPYTCSATVVDSPNHTVIITAGHCVTERSSGTATKLAFVPAYAEGARPFGTWVFRRIATVKAWRKRGNFNFDFAAVAMSPRDGVRIQDEVGGIPLATGLPVKQTYAATGYPINHSDTEVMWRCTSPFAGHDPRPLKHGPKPIAIGCDMEEGASGGGWTVDGHLNSVTSFGYLSRENVLFGPYFGKKTALVYRKVAGGSSE